MNQSWSWILFHLDESCFREPGGNGFRPWWDGAFLSHQEHREVCYLGIVHNDRNNYLQDTLVVLTSLRTIAKADCTNQCLFQSQNLNEWSFRWLAVQRYEHDSRANGAAVPYECHVLHEIRLQSERMWVASFNGPLSVLWWYSVLNNTLMRSIQWGEELLWHWQRQ